MAKKQKTKRELIDEFNKEIERKISKGIPEENLPSKVSQREYKNLSMTEARRLERAIKNEDFVNQIYSSQKKDGTIDVVLTSGMQVVDRIRTEAHNRFQQDRRERIKSLPTYDEQDEYSKRSLEFRGDLVNLTEGSDTLPLREKAKRIRSHERFYETSGGENLKKMLVAAIENQNALMDLTEYLDWIKGIDADIIEDVYYSDVDFDVKEFYQSQFQDEFITELNIFKEKFQQAAEKNKKMYSKEQLKSVKNEGKFYSMTTKRGEILGLTYKSKINESGYGYTTNNGKRTRVYFKETF